MRRSATWLIAGALALIGFLAARDALQSAGGPPARPQAATDTSAPNPPGPPSIADRSRVEAELRRTGVSGVVFFTDEDCRLWALNLPEVDYVSERADRAAGCELSVSPNGRRVFAGETVVWSPDGRLAARCRGSRTEILGRTGMRTGELPGCAPAWRPDGKLTLAQRDEVLAVRLPCADLVGSCAAERVLGRRELLRASRFAGGPFRDLHSPLVAQIAWLDDTRAAVVLSAADRNQGDSRIDVLALFEKGALLGRPLLNRSFGVLRVSPGSAYLAVHGALPRGLVFLDRSGNLLAQNPLASGHHATWSPDARWTAIATGGSVYVFRTDEIAQFESRRRPSTIRIPIYAGDLAWR